MYGIVLKYHHIKNCDPWSFDILIVKLFQAKVIKSASDNLALLEARSVEVVKARHNAVDILHGQGPQFVALRPTTKTKTVGK